MNKTNYLKITLLFVFAFSNVSSWCQDKKSDKQMNNYIDLLLKKMTIDEKLGQLNLVTPWSNTGPFATKNYKKKILDGTGGNVFGLLGSPATVHRIMKLVDSTRLKIPMLSGLDIIHGYKTIFPIPLGLASTWDANLVQKTARVAAIEASAVGYNWTFSPMVDLTRDPRWGRVMEGFGEDPYLAGLFGQAMVRGYQGDNLKNESSLMTCVKHFAMYGAAEAGRDYNTTDMSKLAMYQDYLPPYKATIDAGAGSVMTSFNTVDGIPASANKWLMTTLLREEWGFKGFVVTDFNAIGELIDHGVAADREDAARLSLNAGVDMDMASEAVISSMKKLIKEGKINSKQVDLACRRVLEAKYKLGLFENADRNFDPSRAVKVSLTEENLQVAKEASLKSMVLLKNEHNTLPLKKEMKIALIGPFADKKEEMFSNWTIIKDESKVVSIYSGIKQITSNIEVAKGTLVSDNVLFNANTSGSFDPEVQKRLEKEAFEIAQKSDIIVAVLGEPLLMSGEATSRADIGLPNCQKELLELLKTTGKPIVLILVNGRPMTIEADIKNVDAVLETWRLGTKAGDAIADVLYGNYNPSGKLTMTFPRSVGQIPLYYNHRNTGKPVIEGEFRKFASKYLDIENTPLFPFGYGLSYTTFAYSPIKLSNQELKGNATLTASIEVSNTGKVAGEETVQLYLQDKVASVARPVKELKNYKKVILQPGEVKSVSFELKPEDLKFYNSELKYDWESGDFNIYIGTNSQEVQKATFKWIK